MRGPGVPSFQVRSLGPERGQPGCWGLASPSLPSPGRSGELRLLEDLGGGEPCAWTGHLPRAQRPRPLTGKLKLMWAKHGLSPTHATGCKWPLSKCPVRRPRMREGEGQRKRRGAQPGMICEMKGDFCVKAPPVEAAAVMGFGVGWYPRAQGPGWVLAGRVRCGDLRHGGGGAVCRSHVCSHGRAPRTLGRKPRQTCPTPSTRDAGCSTGSVSWAARARRRAGFPAAILSLGNAPLFSRALICGVSSALPRISRCSRLQLRQGGRPAPRDHCPS